MGKVAERRGTRGCRTSCSKSLTGTYRAGVQVILVEEASCWFKIIPLVVMMLNPATYHNAGRLFISVLRCLAPGRTTSIEVICDELDLEGENLLCGIQCGKVGFRSD